MLMMLVLMLLSASTSSAADEASNILIRTTSRHNVFTKNGVTPIASTVAPKSGGGVVGGLMCWLFGSCKRKCCKNRKRGYDAYGNPYGLYKGFLLDHIYNSTEESTPYAAETYYTSKGITSDYTTYCGNAEPIKPFRVGPGVIEWQEHGDYGNCNPANVTLTLIAGKPKSPDRWNNSYVFDDGLSYGSGDMKRTCLPCNML